jgi:uncharacterized membrane protein YciS (DUF1049 family)
MNPFKRRLSAYIETALLACMLTVGSYAVSSLFGIRIVVLLPTVSIIFLLLQLVLTQFQVAQLSRQVQRLRDEMDLVRNTTESVMAIVDPSRPKS